MFKHLKRGLAVASSAVLGTVATSSAYAMDTTAITTYLNTDVTTALNAIGGAVIVLAALAMGFKWVKGMLFG